MAAIVPKEITVPVKLVPQFVMGDKWVDEAMTADAIPTEGRRFTALLAVEEHRVADGRMFRYGALSSRQVPLPLMFLKRNSEGHNDAVFVGNLTRIWREGSGIRAEGVFDTSEDAMEAVRLVSEGKMNGVSIDTIPTKYELIVDDEGAITGIDFLAATLIGATIVPFPAFEQTFVRVEDDEDEDDERRTYLAADALSPAFPNIDAEAFTIPEPDAPFPWTVLEDGRVFGHLAIWGECHNAINDTCAIAPRSKTNYAQFLVGSIGGKRLGNVTMNTIHPGGGMTREQVARHYGDTGTVAAIVTITDGKFGPWVCGQVDPNLSAADRLRLSVCGISGDWRGNELIGILAVPKAGFTVPRFEDDYALVASAMEILDDECIGCEESRKAAEEINELLDSTADEATVEEPEVEEVVETVDEHEPTEEELETDDDLAAELETVLDEVLGEIEARRSAEEAEEEYQRFLELVG